MTGALLGTAFGLGLVLVVAGIRRLRAPSLASRVVPYVRDVVDSSTADTGAGMSAALRPVRARAARVVAEISGGAESVRRRLDRLGSGDSVEEFRVRQSVWGFAGFSACAALSILAWSGLAVNLPALLVFCGVGFVVGALACDQNLTSQVRRHEERAAEEFPVVADLLALAVAAGESPVAGLERVLAVSSGSLSDDLGRVLGEVRTGTPVADAFLRLASRTGVPSIARFSEGLAVAVERGTPLVDVLAAQAADVRETTRRQLIEAGGRKEIAMMLPVVFLVLPVTVVFAFFPGYIGLTMST